MLDVPLQEEPVDLHTELTQYKVLPRWAAEDEVLRWRLKYRHQQDLNAIANEPTAPDAETLKWVELELRPFTRELPLAGLEHGVVYLFSVALETVDGWSDWSQVVSCIPPSPQVPGKCAAVLPTVVGNHKVLLRWTRPIDVAVAGSISCGCILRYRVFAHWTGYTPGENTGTLTGEFDMQVEGDVDECEVDNLECCREYRFQVAAENVSGEGPLSDSSEPVSMPLPVPESPPMPMVRRPGHKSVIIQWQHPLSEAPLEGFTFRYTTGKDWESDSIEELNGVPVNLSQTTISGLKPGSTYIFQVRGISKYGDGYWSETSIPVNTLNGSVPAKVADLEVAHLYRSFISLQWSPPNDHGFDVTQQLLRFSFHADMSQAMEIEPSVRREKSKDMCELRHLQKKVYYFQVVALNKLGAGEWSEPLKVDLQTQALTAQAAVN